MSIKVKSGGSYADIQGVFVKQGGAYQAASVFAKVAGAYQAVGGGPEPWTPAAISTALWLDSADATTIVLNGANVAQWLDKSGNNRHAANPVASEQPVYTLSGLNALPVLTFNGTTHRMNFNGSHTAAWSCAVVAAPTNPASSAQQQVFQFLTGALAAQGGVQIQVNTWGAVSSGAGFGAARARVTGVGDIVTATHRVSPSALSSIWTQGGGPSTATTPVSQAVTNATLSGIGSTGSTSRYFAGQICEVIVADGEWTTDTRQRVEGYLAHKWGRASSLPVDHPYRNGGPTL